MNIAIVAAAGRGKRMGSERPKQFLELAGIPVIVHTLRRFEQSTEINEVVVVLSPEDVAEFHSLAGSYSLKKVVRVVPGGDTRAESVWKGLESIRSVATEIVAVHDGVRPFVTADEIDAVVREARISGAAILTAPIIDTIKEVNGQYVTRTVDRRQLRRALTPQCFRYNVLRKAFEQSLPLDETVTDECFLVEKLGVKVSAIEGNTFNIKLTGPADLVIGEALLRISQGAPTDGP
jgi:2-C-methyl-D-erythritol 4-phosphate cytidylyltransferase